VNPIFTVTRFLFFWFDILIQKLRKMAYSPSVTPQDFPLQSLHHHNGSSAALSVAGSDISRGSKGTAYDDEFRYKTVSLAD
jgi:hypothetical protein